MSTITKEFTKEQLIEKLQHRISVASGFPESEKAQMDLELARIALESLEAEAVAYIIQDADARSRGEKGILRYFANISDEDINEYEITVTPLYTAPPAPVAVPDEITFEKIAEITASQGYEYSINECICAASWWNACRAAMLQGAEPVTTDYKLPANTPCKDAPEHIWLQTAGVWPENGEFSELTWCSDNQHPDDTLYVRADVVPGNSPVNQDGWVACSERMPEEGSKVIVFRPRASESNDPPVKTATYKGGREYYHGFDCYCEPTHWMPMPAAPQQESKP